MEKFEFQPKIEKPREKNKEEQKPVEKKKSIFEKLYKSKTARLLAFLGFLGTSSTFLPKAKYEYQKPSKTYELVEHRKLDLKELSEKFKSEIQIPHEKRSIVHIGQIHGADTIQETQEKIDIKEAISNQKGLEELLLFLSKNYQLRNFYAEGLVEGQLQLIGAVKNEINSIRKDEERLPPETWNRLLNLYTSADLEKVKSEMPERYRAYVIYLSKCEFDKEINSLDNEYRRYEDEKEKPSEKYGKLFQIWSEKGVNSQKVFDNLEKQKNIIANHELIQGDRVYIWGAPMKLYLEGKINLIPAETLEANQQAFTPYPGSEITFTKEQLKDPKERERFEKLLEERKEIQEARHNIREDAAIDIITSSPDFQTQQFIPLIYGVGHNFKDNVEKFNKESPDQEIGLIQVSSK